MPAQQCLRHRVHLIVVRAVGKLHALFDEVIHPGRVRRMRQVNVPASISGLMACARAIFPPLGFTGMMPGISHESI
jgi:hypothetical protein